MVVRGRERSIRKCDSTGTKLYKYTGYTQTFSQKYFSNSVNRLEEINDVI